MKGIKKLTLALLLLIFFPIIAFADIPVARGGYADINVGYSKVYNSDYIDSVTGLGLNFNLGYKMMPFFAFEAGYTTYGASKSSFTGANAFDAALKGIIPFVEVGMEIFAKLGPVYVTNSKLPDGVSSHTTNVYYGFGGDYAWTPGMLITLQWAQANGNSNTGNFQLLSIGATYIF